MKKSAFTIIELAVVLFVILVIAAILFPVFARYRESQRPSCQGNLKQISLGFKQYTQDWSELFPKAAFNNTALTKYNAKLYYGWADALQPYLKSTEIYQCAGKSQYGGAFQPYEAGYTDYYFNRQVAGQNEMRFNNSANTILLGDGNDGADINDARYVHSSVPSAWVKDTSSPLYRHSDGANYAFVDGHVKWLRAGVRPTTQPTNGSNFTFAS